MVLITVTSLLVLNSDVKALRPDWPWVQC